MATTEETRDPSASGIWRSASGVWLTLGALALLLIGLAIRSDLVFGLVVLAAIFVPLEQLFAVRRHRVFRKRWASDLVHFVFNNLLGTVGVVAAVVLLAGVPYLLMPDVIRAAIAAQPTIVQFLEALAIVELCGYWAHRATHTVPFLWRFHKVHHSIEEMDWLAAGRLHPLDQVFTRTCVVAPLFVLGFSRATFGAFLVFTALHAIFIHANLRFLVRPAPLGDRHARVPPLAPQQRAPGAQYELRGRDAVARRDLRHAISAGTPGCRREGKRAVPGALRHRRRRTRWLSAPTGLAVPPPRAGELTRTTRRPTCRRGAVRSPGGPGRWRSRIRCSRRCCRCCSWRLRCSSPLPGRLRSRAGHRSCPN